jgi:hypothetical protein
MGNLGFLLYLEFRGMGTVALSFSNSVLVCNDGVLGGAVSLPQPAPVERGAPYISGAGRVVHIAQHLPEKENKSQFQKLGSTTVTANSIASPERDIDVSRLVIRGE